MGLGRVELPTSRLSGSFRRTRIGLRSSYSPTLHEHPAQSVAHLGTSCALPRTFCASEWTPQRTPSGLSALDFPRAAIREGPPMRPGFTGTPRYPDVELKCEYELSKDKKPGDCAQLLPLLLWHSPNKGLPRAGIGNPEPYYQSAAISRRVVDAVGLGVVVGRKQAEVKHPSCR